MITEKQEGIKEKIFQEVLKIIPFEGCSEETLQKAFVNVNLDKNLAGIIFPDGMDEVIEHIVRMSDQEMLAELQKLDLKNMRVRDKIITAIKIRLMSHSSKSHEIRVKKLVVSKLLSYFQLPFNSSLGFKLLWNTSDVIWSDVILDKSQDFNYYTKRALLAGIYSSTLLYWLQDESANSEETFAYLDRRIDDVLELGKRFNKK